MSDTLHDNKTVGQGGRMTHLYAWGLVTTGAPIDYVMRALVSRGVEAELAKSIVLECFADWRNQLRSCGRRNVALGLAFIGAGVLLSIMLLLPAFRRGLEIGLMALHYGKLTFLPVVAGIGLSLWGWGQLRKADRIRI